MILIQPKIEVENYNPIQIMKNIDVITTHFMSHF